MIYNFFDILCYFILKVLLSTLSVPTGTEFWHSNLLLGTEWHSSKKEKASQIFPSFAWESLTSFQREYNFRLFHFPAYVLFVLFVSFFLHFSIKNTVWINTPYYTLSFLHFFLYYWPNIFIINSTCFNRFIKSVRISGY